MKTSRTKINSRTKITRGKKQRRAMGALVHRGNRHRRFVYFPQMKGRVVKNVELFTMSDFRSITIDFEDKTALNLIIEPALLIDSHFSDFSSGDERVVKRWPTVRSVINRD